MRGPGKVRRVVTGMVALALLGACTDGARLPIDPEPGDTTRADTNRVVASIPSLGLGPVPNRFTSELWVRGNWAYTGTWGNRGANRVSGNALNIWDVSGAVPQLRDSILISNATTLGDVQVSDDGRLLVVSTERAPGSIVIFDLTNPGRPVQVSRFSSQNTFPGVHTAEVARVSGRLLAFLSIDPSPSTLDPSPSRLVIVDITNERSPREVLARDMGNPFIHDVFVRDGILFTALWNAGTDMWDIGGGGRGGTPENPVRISTLVTQGGKAHNVFWSGRGSRVIAERYVFVGEEGPGSGAFGTSSSGDVHVVDISNPASPREVAFFNVPGAGTHNFSVDEQSGVLYAAYYNAGVKALDVRGDLGSCTDAQKSDADHSNGVLMLCDLRKMGRLLGEGLAKADPPVYVWGVHWQDGRLYASDMLNGLWKLDASALRR